MRRSSRVRGNGTSTSDRWPRDCCALACGALLLLASPVRALPFRYTASFTVDPFTDLIGLTGARMTVEFVLDTDVMTPSFDGPFSGGHATSWYDTNTTVSLTVTGSAGVDGTYTGSTQAGASFVLRDNVGSAALALRAKRPAKR